MSVGRASNLFLHARSGRIPIGLAIGCIRSEVFVPLKIAVLSDIHSNLDALDAVMKDLPNVDNILCLGDLVGYGPQPNEVIAELQRLQPLMVLLGNHDNSVLTGDTAGLAAHAELAVKWTRKVIGKAELQYLSSLQPSGRLELGGIAIALFHGSPRNPISDYVYPDSPRSTLEDLAMKGAADVVMLGHTHMPMQYLSTGKLLANPGSVGQPRDGDPRASYAILTLSGSLRSSEIRRVEYDVDSVAEKITESGLPGYLADRLYVGL